MVKSPPVYKVGKRSKRSVFDLRDMLIAVEDAEDEALHTEKSKRNTKKNVFTKIVFPSLVLKISCFLQC